MIGTQPATTSVFAPSRTHPPKPSLVLHIGVTGHRPDKSKRPDPDVEAIRGIVRQMLSLIRRTAFGIATTNAPLFRHADGEAVGPAPVTLRILSSLAEGADQWVADEARKLDYELHSALPFARREYAKDFAGPVLAEYQRLLGEAKVTLELDGTRSDARESASYEAAGRAIIQQSDLLIAIWDGEDKKGRGGTGQMVHEALQCGVPVIWIKWTALTGEWQLMSRPNWQLLEGSDDKEGDTAHLTKIITSILLPPDLCAKPAWREKNSLRTTFYLENQPRWSWLRGFWGFFLSCILLEKPKWVSRIHDFEDATQNSWKEEWGNGQDVPSSDVIKGINALYLPHYAWANQLSMFYGGIYRSSFVLIYLLGALAVFFALLGVPALVHHANERPSIIIELLLIGAVISLIRWGRRRRWHERWIEYRTLAERLRLSRFMALLGGWRQQTAMPGHLAGYGDPVNTWVYWHYRAMERSAGLPDACMDEGRLKAVQFAFQEILAQEQIKYHEGNCSRLHIMDLRLHRLGEIFFFATFMACGIHLGLELGLERVPSSLSILLVTLNALLPACGAALAAIRSQGEFHRIARRSEAMCEELKELQQQLSFVATTGDDLRSQEMRRVIERIARLMLNETLDWRIVFQDRPLVLPG